MKHILYSITLLAVLCLGTVSCKKFLEKEPIGRVGKETLFEDVNGAKLALNGCYNTVLSYYRAEFSMYADVTSDNLLSKSAATSVMLPQFNFQSTSGDDAFAVGHIWLDIFESLNNINNVINALPQLKTKFAAQADELDNINAQAMVLRALCQFDLCRIYAQPYNYTADASHMGVPVLLKTPSPGMLVARNTVKEVYDQVITDINNALPVLARNRNTTQAYINYPAAAGLLSRVYLYKGDWAQSVSAANTAINAANGFTLAAAADYRPAFTTYPKAGTTVETMFQLTNNGNTTFGAQDVNVIFSDSTAAEYKASAKILNLFDATDIRRTEMFSVINGQYFTRKFIGGKKVLTIQVLRLAEVYLNRAEAQWNLGKYTEAADDIRIISQRAHPAQTVTINYASPADLYKQIADERNRELCFENHRFFDIVRRKENLQRGNDCNSTTCSLTYPNDKFVLPITTKEIEANRSLKQNPGY